MQQRNLLSSAKPGRRGARLERISAPRDCRYAAVCWLALTLAGCSPAPDPPGRQPTAGNGAAAGFARGEAVYRAHCAVCHQPDGRGVAAVHPPLNQTAWVLGSKERLIDIVLNGLSERIVVHGEVYEGVMPALPYLSDSEVAAVLTYIRNSFGNRASAVSTAEVKTVRAGKSLNESAVDFADVRPVTDYAARRKLQGPRVQSRVGNVFQKGQLYMDTLRVPAGFSIRVFASGLENPRSLALGDRGTVFVGTRRNKTDFIYAIRDEDGDWRADTVNKISRGLKWRPMGVAMRGSDLYVGEIDRIVKFANIEQHLPDPPEPVLVFTYPPEPKHGDKYIRFGPDDKLYVPVGAPCNSCLEENPIFSSITRINPDGSGFEIFAHGVRNSRGYDWHPLTRELWLSDHGRDLMGDDMPPCEINLAPAAGMHFGFPFCHGRDIADPEFGSQRRCNEFTPTVFDLPAHVAPVSLKFYTGSQFPPQYRNQILLAEHGSWNRTRKVGYRLSLLQLEGNRVVGYRAFVDGWLDEEKNDAWGRPADILQMPDGSVLLSDDYAGVIYRIAYEG